MQNEKTERVNDCLLGVLSIDGDKKSDKVVERKFNYWYFSVLGMNFWEYKFLENLQVLNTIQFYHSTHFNDKIYATISLTGRDKISPKIYF